MTFKNALLVSCACLLASPALARSWSFGGSFTGSERTAVAVNLGYQFAMSDRIHIIGPRITQKIDTIGDERKARYEYALAWQQLVPLGGFVSSSSIYLGGTRFRADADAEAKGRGLLGLEYGIGMVQGNDVKFLPSIVAGICLRPSEKRPVTVGGTEVQSTTAYAGIDLRFF